MGAQVFKVKHYPEATDSSPQAPASNADPKKISLSRAGHSITITNLDNTDSLKISFDGGYTYFTILKGTTVSFDAFFHYFYVRSSGSAINWCALVQEG